jgi:hypothetical protein
VNEYKNTFAPMSQDLPDNVHLLTFMADESKSPDYVLRLQHLFEKGDGQLAHNVSGKVHIFFK